jgi:EpsI family protein
MLASRTRYDEADRRINLEANIPKAFGDWELQPAETTVIVNPEQAAAISRIYDEILSRTYVNRVTKRQVMLSIAYGSNQSHETQVHKPEACYPAQGFKLDSMTKDVFDIDGRVVPVTTLHATLGQRSEYVAYWIMQGDQAVRGALGQNFGRALQAFRGVVSGGLLFRVSEITVDSATTFQVQQGFASALVAASDSRLQNRLVGLVTK